ncbi:hypothetical protein Tco_0627177 [Tanacetum coccineum]|uniref:Uncharacterized protein n=1 Tax=Tanacetum coccineum TaxID=301880 RepID=A0ABQ4WLQ5_9ASTR
MSQPMMQYEKQQNKEQGQTFNPKWQLDYIFQNCYCKYHAFYFRFWNSTWKHCYQPKGDLKGITIHECCVTIQGTKKLIIGRRGDKGHESLLQNGSTEDVQPPVSNISLVIQIQMPHGAPVVTLDQFLKHQILSIKEMMKD